MRRRSRLLRVAKWGGVVTCVLIGIVAIASARWYLGWCSATGHTRIGVSDAALYVNSIGRDVIVVSPMALGWQIGEHEARIKWLGGWDHFRPFPIRDISIPLWMPFAVAVILTAYLFRLDRRPPPGHCPCGYDLTGNVSGTCPECGKEAANVER